MQRLNTISPVLALHTLTVPSKDAVQSSSGFSLCGECGPVGVHFKLKISFECPFKSNFNPDSAARKNKKYKVTLIIP